VALFTFEDVLNTKRMDAQYLGAWDILVGGCETLRFTRDGEALVPRRQVLSSIQTGGVTYLKFSKLDSDFFRLPEG
jgi:hypothetical protein